MFLGGELDSKSDWAGSFPAASAMCVDAQNACVSYWYKGMTQNRTLDLTV